jgi:hypothetical protein
MRHFASRSFWLAYEKLPAATRALADKNYALLRQDPHHPSLHLKKVGRFWSVRIGLRYRALAVETDDGLIWFWTGSHADYDAMIEQP